MITTVVSKGGRWVAWSLWPSMLLTTVPASASSLSLLVSFSLFLLSLSLSPYAAP
jgi:hypothetical protein